MGETVIEGNVFREFSKKDGTIELTLMGQSTSTPYKSTNYINDRETVGYTAVEMEGDVKIAFISKCPSGAVYTTTGDYDGEAPLPLENARMWNVKNGSPLSTYYLEHLKALKGEVPEPDAEWLRKEVEEFPNRITALMAKFLDGFVGQMMNALAGPDGMMTKMAEGLGDALQKGLGGIAGEGQPQEKPPLDIRLKADIVKRPGKPEKKPPAKEIAPKMPRDKKPAPKPKKARKMAKPAPRPKAPMRPKKGGKAVAPRKNTRQKKGKR